MAIRIGLLDSGVAPELCERVKTARCFVNPSVNPSVNPRIEPIEAGALQDHINHATPLSRILRQQAPEAELVIAKVFDQKPVTTAAIVARALDWLAAQGVEIITMSFGLREDRPVLRQACEQALARGCVLLGAAPAQGAPVYPSAYPGVVRVTGDARCGPGVYSHLDSPQADIGACAYWRKGDQEQRQIGGASFAVPYVAGRMARLLSEGGHREELLQQFVALPECRFQGPEVR